MSRDSIERSVDIEAPRSRVWQAIADSRRFGEWFKASLDAPFVAGTTVSGRILEPGYEHLGMEMIVERVEPEELFAFRWHPGVPETDGDDGGGPTTLVEFRLSDIASGTRVTVTESGFDRLPEERRARDLASNDEGWAIQVERIKDYVTAQS